MPFSVICLLYICYAMIRFLETMASRGASSKMGMFDKFMAKWKFKLLFSMVRSYSDMGVIVWTMWSSCEICWRGVWHHRNIYACYWSYKRSHFKWCAQEIPPLPNQDSKVIPRGNTNSWWIFTSIIVNTFLRWALKYSCVCMCSQHACLPASALLCLPFVPAVFALKSIWVDLCPRYNQR